VRLVANPGFVKGRGVVHHYLSLRHRAAREGQIMRSASHFIGRTDWDRAVLAILNPEAHYYHCDEVVRPEFYAAQWQPKGHTGVRIYSTSSALMGKGTECLLEALSILRRQGMSDIRLRVAGVYDGSEPAAIYRRAARRRGVERMVDWLGRIDAAEIAAELLAADVFAYPSHADNSPNSLVEAMLVGVPCVASWVGGIPTLMKHEREGLLFPRGDAMALAAALRRLLCRREEAARFAAGARKTARVRNDPARIATRTVEIYAELIRAARPAEPSPAPTS
jgi:glycosyltransferase involved in cell wall biosynthesis